MDVHMPPEALTSGRRTCALWMHDVRKVWGARLPHDVGQ